MNSQSETVAVLMHHQAALRSRFGEFVPDMAGERLLQEASAAIDAYLFGDAPADLDGLLRRTTDHRADPASGVGDAAAALYAAADALVDVSSGRVPTLAGGPHYHGLLGPIALAFAKRAECEGRDGAKGAHDALTCS